MFPFDKKFVDIRFRFPLQGRDLWLMDKARDCLMKSGRPTSVLVGREMFPSGD